MTIPCFELAYFVMCPASRDVISCENSIQSPAVRGIQVIQEWQQVRRSRRRKEQVSKSVVLVLARTIVLVLVCSRSPKGKDNKLWPFFPAAATSTENSAVLCAQALLLSEQSLCHKPDLEHSWENALAREVHLCWQKWILGLEAGQFSQSPRGVDCILAYVVCALHCLQVVALPSALSLNSNTAALANLPQALLAVPVDAGHTIVTVKTPPAPAVRLRIQEAAHRMILPLV